MNKYLNNIKISHLDSKQEQLYSWAGNSTFNPQRLDFFDVDKKVMSDAVVKCLKHIAAVSNSNLLRIDGKNRSTPVKFKLSY